ncbi:hypothetical protein ON010_g4236 [Phytophthora cinnamomi]|nr:hypothetical protein ON010_g4236 [Phytophthora cinnamomi]
MSSLGYHEAASEVAFVNLIIVIILESSGTTAFLVEFYDSNVVPHTYYGGIQYFIAQKNRIDSFIHSEFCAICRDAREEAQGDEPSAARGGGGAEEGAPGAAGGDAAAQGSGGADGHDPKRPLAAAGAVPTD